MYSAEFLMTSLVVVLIPGTGVIYTVSTGLFLGWRSSIAAAIGCTAGIIPHLAVSVLGLTALLHMSALAFQILKYAGSAYLLYLAWGMWRETGTLKVNEPARTRGALGIVIKGILINILNPKLSIFFLAFLPLFVSQGALPPLQQMLMLSFAFMLMTFIIFVLYGILANGIRNYFINSPKMISWLQRSFAAIFAALAVKLAASDQ